MHRVSWLPWLLAATSLSGCLFDGEGCGDLGQVKQDALASLEALGEEGPVHLDMTVESGDEEQHFQQWLDPSVPAGRMEVEEAALTFVREQYAWEGQQLLPGLHRDHRLLHGEGDAVGVPTRALFMAGPETSLDADAWSARCDGDGVVLEGPLQTVDGEYAFTLWADAKAPHRPLRVAFETDSEGFGLVAGEATITHGPVETIAIPDGLARSPAQLRVADVVEEEQDGFTVRHGALTETSAWVPLSELEARLIVDGGGGGEGGTGSGEENGTGDPGEGDVTVALYHDDLDGNGLVSAGDRFGVTLSDPDADFVIHDTWAGDDLNMMMLGLEVSENAPVTSPLQFESVRGLRDSAEEPALQDLEVYVKIPPGATDVDASQVRIQLDTPGAGTTFMFGSEADADHFSVQMERDADGSYTDEEPAWTSGDLARVRIDLEAANMTLATRTEVALRLIPEIGASAQVSFTTPNSYGTKTIIDLY